MERQLTESNYHSPEQNRKFFSVSQFKDFMRCEAMAMAKISGDYYLPSTKSMLVGSYVDAYFDGALPQFMEQHPEVFTRQGELKCEFRKANEIISRITADELFMQFMGGEKQKILTFEAFGVPWKMKMDSFLPGVCITDLKVVSDFRSLPRWRYDIQGAIYQLGVEIILEEKLPFYLAVATKEQTVDLDIFQIPQPTLDMALREVEDRIGRFALVKAGLEPPEACGHCDYCKSRKAAAIRNYNELLEE